MKSPSLGGACAGGRLVQQCRGLMSAVKILSNCSRSVNSPQSLSRSPPVRVWGLAVPARKESRCEPRELTPKGGSERAVSTNGQRKPEPRLAGLCHAISSVGESG